MSIDTSARTLATAIVATSISVMFLRLPYGWIMFIPGRLFKFPPEVWRFATAFFLSGPKLELIMDPYFAYQNLSQLEMSNTKFSRKEDLLWYLITVGGFTMVGAGLSSPAPFPIAHIHAHTQHLVYLPA